MLKQEEINLKLKKPEEMASFHSTKVTNASKLDTSLKKLYLPKIQKRTIQTLPISSLNRQLVKSRSQAFLTADNKDSESIDPNEEKEKLMLAKLSLSRINGKINDLKLNYKKLLLEKEENLGIIKDAMRSNDPVYIENLYLKIEQMLEDSMKNYTKKTLTTHNYESKFTEEKNNKSYESKDKINIGNIKDENDNLNVKINPENEKENVKEEKVEKNKFDIIENKKNEEQTNKENNIKEEENEKNNDIVKGENKKNEDNEKEEIKKVEDNIKNENNKSEDEAKKENKNEENKKSENNEKEDNKKMEESHKKENKKNEDKKRKKHKKSEDNKEESKKSKEDKKVEIKINEEENKKNDNNKRKELKKSKTKKYKNEEKNKKEDNKKEENKKK